MNKRLGVYIGVLVLVLVIGVFAGFLLTLTIKWNDKIIKDPMIIYDNHKIEKMDRQGIIGVISEAQMKEMLNIQETVPFK